MMRRHYAKSRCLVCGKPCPAGQTMKITIVGYALLEFMPAKRTPHLLKDTTPTRCHKKCRPNLVLVAVHS